MGMVIREKNKRAGAHSELAIEQIREVRTLRRRLFVTVRTKRGQIYLKINLSPFTRFYALLREEKPPPPSRIMQHAQSHP